jgi:hypothetical protein
MVIVDLMIDLWLESTFLQLFHFFLPSLSSNSLLLFLQLGFKVFAVFLIRISNGWWNLLEPFVFVGLRLKRALSLLLSNKQVSLFFKFHLCSWVAHVFLKELFAEVRSNRF